MSVASLPNCDDTDYGDVNYRSFQVVGNQHPSSQSASLAEQVALHQLPVIIEAAAHEQCCHNSNNVALKRVRLYSSTIDKISRHANISEDRIKIE